jgi:predicted transcriptional regulator
MKTNQQSIQGRTKTYTSFYKPPSDAMPADPNLVKLQALHLLLSIPLSKIAKMGGVSPAYMTRLFNGSLKGSSSFYMRVESHLGELVNSRSRQYFQVETISVETAQEVMGVMGVMESIQKPL